MPNYNFMSKRYLNQLDLHRLTMNQINRFRQELEMLDENADIKCKEYLQRRIECQLSILKSTEFLLRTQLDEDEENLTSSEKNNRLIAKKND
jgi:hypothetical protein